MLMEELESLLPAECRIEIRGVKIFAIAEMIDFGVDAVVNEQDTACVLVEAEAVSEPEESPELLVERMVGEKLPEPGSLLIEEGYPLRLHAIVHDLDREPTWREAWVTEALDRILVEIELRPIASLVMPMLAVRHGSMSAERFIQLLRQFLERASATLERLYLVLPAGMDCALLKRV